MPTVDASGGKGDQTESPRPFSRVGWWAWRVKTVIQMIIGALTALGALGIAVCDMAHHRAMDAGTDALGVTAAGLAVAAAIELAYTLFTPGPDEAVNPLL